MIKGNRVTEVVIVLITLSVLAAIAIPKMQDFKLDKQITATKTLATALSGASTANQAARKKHAPKSISIANCQDVAKLLKDGVLPSGYSIAEHAVPVNGTVACVLSGPSNTTADFSVVGVK